MDVSNDLISIAYVEAFHGCNVIRKVYVCIGFVHGQVKDKNHFKMVGSVR